MKSKTMMTKLACLMLLVGTFVCAADFGAQGFQWREIRRVDDFASNTVLQVEEVGATAAFSFVQEASVLGSERDTVLRIASDEDDVEVILRRNGSSKAWTSENTLRFTSTNGTNALLTLQYDGTDESIDIDKDGLGGIDFAHLGEADGLLLNFESDAPVFLFFTFFSGKDSSLSANVSTSPSGSVGPQSLFVPFSHFVGDADLYRIGAFVFNIYMPPATTSFVLRDFSVVTTATRLLLVAPFQSQCLPPSSSSSASSSEHESTEDDKESSSSSSSSTVSTTDEEEEQQSNTVLVVLTSSLSPSLSFASTKTSLGGDNAVVVESTKLSELLSFVDQNSSSSLTPSSSLLSLLFLLLSSLLFSFLL
eukprot:TRINITY_DN843_c0_g1_i1.p1 TRINITY_DN843_c0_g1~~TRINITY_DN843_c0_g1_i1.p1  ORF type:complete len:392 (-),score=135.97 TRINITY_DN843_c0_g1_i1:267-1358(-)